MTFCGSTVMPGRRKLAALQFGHHRVGVAVERQAGQPAERRGRAFGQPGHRAEVDDAEAAVGEHAEVARVRVGVQQPGPFGRREVQQRQPVAGAVALGGGAGRDDRRQLACLRAIR